MSRIIFDALFFILPVIVAKSWMLMNLVKTICDLNKYRKCGENKKKYDNIYIRIVLYALFFILGIYLIFFMIWMVYYPSYNLSIILRIIGYHLYAGFWGGLLILSSFRTLDPSA